MVNTELDLRHKLRSTAKKTDEKVTQSTSINHVNVYQHVFLNVNFNACILFLHVARGCYGHTILFSFYYSTVVLLVRFLYWNCGKINKIKKQKNNNSLTTFVENVGETED